MGEPIKITTGISASTFQAVDKSNFTVAGYDAKFAFDKFSLSTMIGGATDFNGTNSAIIDLKSSVPYDERGIFSFGSRIRNNISNNGSSTQFRVTPIKVSVPLDEKNSVYLDPHYVGKINYKTGEWSNSAGAFVGVCHKFNKNLSGFAEVQAYNLDNWNKENRQKTSGNVGVCWTF